ncbi:MAG: glycosyl transferase [Mesorhizobium amorphae]|nr:MAG: glycosyl transferase [Mesorhizobium amorphae]
MKGRAYVIHLARAEGRRAHAETLAGNLPLPGELLEAVDARRMTKAEEAAYRPRLLRPSYPFALRPTEIACFHSHRKAWRRIAESGDAGGLILEDDVAVDGAILRAILSLAQAELRPDDYLRFPQNLRDETGPMVAEGEGVSIIRPRVAGRRMFAQWVGREAALKLLAATERFDRPVDALLQLSWLLPVRVLAARPIAVREISGTLGGSTVQGKGRGLSAVVEREVKRPLYRMAVHVHGWLKG